MLEDGAYRRLMDTIYLREGPLPADREQVHRLVKAFTKAEKTAVDSILAEFFVLTDAGYTNARCDEELAETREKSERARQSGLASGRSRKRSTTVERQANERSTSHKPVTSNQSSSSTARATRNLSPATTVSSRSNSSTGARLTCRHGSDASSKTSARRPASRRKCRRRSTASRSWSASTSIPSWQHGVTAWTPHASSGSGT